MSRLTRFITVILLASSIGLHWAVLQSVAWMGMLVAYSAESNFSEAVVKTFDGQHPCKLCLTVTEGKKADTRKKMLKGSEKIDSVIVVSEVLLCPPVSVAVHPLDQAGLSPLRNAPPTPPPRSV